MEVHAMRRHHEVPTHLNVEDKVLLGLTVRQFLYILVGSSAAYTLWSETTWLPDAVRVSLAAACLAASLAFALLRPYERALEEWLVATLVYVASPRHATWQPAEPRLADWRAAGGGWQELAPGLSWAEDDGEWH
jgi:hypothetical protein